MPRLGLAFLGVLLPLLAQQPDAILKKAIAAHQAGDLDTAIKSYREFLKLKPNSGEVRSNLGAALARKGDFEAAIAEYETALHDAPGNTGVAFNLAVAYYKMGEVRRAASELNALQAATGGSNQQVTMLLADCLLQLGENARVIDLLRLQADVHADDLAVAYLLGSALIRDGQYSAGQQLLDKILKNGESAEARLLIGTAKLGIADFAGALDDLAKAVALNPKLPSVNSFYGQALMATGDTTAAAKAFRAELALNPNDFDSNLNLASILRQDQQYDEASALLARALHTRPGDLRTRYQIGTIALSTGKVDRARSELEAVVKEAPKFTEAHVSLATVYYRLKRKEDGDRERALVLKLNEEAQAKQPKGQEIGK
jgi:tetratricopeptide (TPR) repeat protein